MANTPTHIRRSNSLSALLQGFHLHPKHLYTCMSIYRKENMELKYYREIELKVS